MGCWNQTCSLTTLPITYGDEIVLIPLVENHDNPIPSLMYHVNSNYEVFGLPIYGKYNDYGGIEDVNTHMSNIQFYTETQLFEYKRSRNPEDSELVKFNKENLDEFFSNCICEEILYVKCEDEVRNLSMMMIHKGLYEKLIEEMGNVIPYKQTKTLRELHYERIKNKIQEIKTTKKEYEEFDDLKWFNKYIIKEKTQDCCMIGLCDTSITYDFVISSLMNNMDETLIYELVNMLLFKRALMHLRKGYLTISGAGSQSNDLYFHKVVADFVNEYIEKKIQERKEYDKEEFNETDFLRESIFWWKD